MVNIKAKSLPLFLLTLFVTGLQGIEFPDGFLFGVASSAYQVEGAWNVSGKSASIWDHFVHTQPEVIRDGTNGDIACDSYHKVQEDVALLKQLGVDFYRFSLAWTRILPSPLTNRVNPDGIRYYNELIDLLLENKIQPVVTLYHWDLPQYLQDLGGFSNALVIDAFVHYAKVAFENFGDRVKIWTTFNQPKSVCLYGYGKLVLAPATGISGISEYLCGHNILKAHAKAYHLYNDSYKAQQGGRLGITLDSDWFEPASTTDDDINAARRAMEFIFGWFAHPIYTKAGDYPKIMKEHIDERSKKEGFKSSRLPTFTKEEIDYIRGTSDFFGLNHYRTFLVSDKKRDPSDHSSSFDKDLSIEYSFDPSWPSTGFFANKVVPWGFSKLLKWIKGEYGNPEIFITENGYADNGEIDDKGRIEFFSLYLSTLSKSIYEDGVNVKAFTAWSLLDNFEWIFGYRSKFGLFHVDFSSPNRTRSPKSSVEYLKQIIVNNKKH